MRPSPSSLPATIVTIAEDDDVLAFLEALDPAYEVPEPAALALTGIAAVYDRHATHWILVLRFQGLPSPSDNGYEVHCFPKASFTRQQVENLGRLRVMGDSGQVLLDSTRRGAN